MRCPTTAPPSAWPSRSWTTSSEEGDSSLLGKTAGKDKAEGKPTYTSLMGLPGAKRFAAELLADANEALASFDARARRLRELATFIVQRER